MSIDYHYRVTGRSGQPKAHFIDAAAWSAAQAADPAIAAWLSEAGFGPTPAGRVKGGATKETYEVLAGKLRAGLARHPLPDDIKGQCFQIEAFLHEVRRATRAGAPKASKAPKVLLAGGLVAAAIGAGVLLMPTDMREGMLAQTLHHIEQTQSSGEPEVENIAVDGPVGSAWTGSKPLFETLETE